MILAPVTERCPSNGRLLQPLVFLLQPPKAVPVVPPAPASRGRLCCRGGHTAPYYSHRWPRVSLYSPTPPVILRRRQPHAAAEPVNPRTPLRVGIHCHVFLGFASSLALRRPLPSPPHRPPPWCSRRGVVNVVKNRLPSEEYCTWRG